MRLALRDVRDQKFASLAEKLATKVNFTGPAIALECMK